MVKLGIKERELVQSKIIDVSHAGNSAQALRLLKMYCEALNTGTSEGGTPMTSLLDEALSVYTGDIVLTRGAISKVRAMFHSHGLQVDTLYSVSPQTQQAALDEGFYVRQRPEEEGRPIRTPLPMASNPTRNEKQLPPDLTDTPATAEASETVKAEPSQANNGTSEVSLPNTDVEPQEMNHSPDESVASLIDFGQSIESIQARIKDQLEKSRQTREPIEADYPQPSGNSTWNADFLETLDGWSTESQESHQPAPEHTVEEYVELPSPESSHPPQPEPPSYPAQVESAPTETSAKTSGWDTVDAFIGFKTPATPTEPEAESNTSTPVASEATVSSADTSVQSDETVSMQSVSDGQTLFIRQTLRSGRVVRYDGHVVIIGDVHAGSEVAATGDVIIWGELHGLAHAGMRGDNFSEIRALHIDAIQLRIGDFIARQPDRIYNHKDSSGNRASTLPNPEVARVSDGEIKVFQGI